MSKRENHQLLLDMLDAAQKIQKCTKRCLKNGL
jgi:uncharacterized protein with HEPN domain